MSPQGKGGGPEASELSTKLVELLERGGEPGVERETLIREAGKIIPPGRAMRQAEIARKGSSKGRGAPSARTRPVSDDRLVQIGRRGIVVSALVNMKAYRQVEQYPDADGVEWVRLLEVPPAVARDRARVRAHHQFDVVEVVDEIRDGTIAASTLLGELTPAQLMRVALELAARERQRATMSPDSTTRSEER